MAQRGDDLAIRYDAVRRLASLPHLRELLTAEGDLGLREIAFARYRNLLAGTDQAHVPLADRLTECGLVADPRVLEHLAR